MLITYEDFQQRLNKRLFDGSREDLLKKIADNPDRFIGLFRPTKPKTKLMQNLTQSHEIKFGDALEEIFSICFERSGFTMLPKRIQKNGTVLSIDQLLQKDNIIYLIEQKVRDDHDSTKKRGQFKNFEDKYFEISNLYPHHTIKPIMWFVDGSLVKNKNYYSAEMAKMQKAYGCSPQLCYGDNLFNVIPTLSNDIWKEIIQHLKQWKELLPDMPELDFDNDSEEVFKEIRGLHPSVYRRLFENEEIKAQILCILFPTGETLAKLKEYFIEKAFPVVYIHIAKLIEEFLKIQNEAKCKTR